MDGMMGICSENRWGKAWHAASEEIRVAGVRSDGCCAIQPVYVLGSTWF